ncbi:hypothetical protein [Mycobacterium sp. P7213]|uniref:hypothetical protein n=1 Tax=Mycobacterium sp. P7213 TaxID=2478465 RepID=UPI000F63C43F|nr:hypothetical protein [Mycobacterium sp. P7213]
MSTFPEKLPSIMGAPVPPINRSAFSPDLTKLTFMMIDGPTSTRAGWINNNGHFTAASPSVELGPFGGTAPSFESVGFDGAGNFYFRSTPTPQGSSELYRLPAGSTTDAQKIDAPTGTITPPLNYDGTMLFGCSGQPQWLGQNAVAVKMSLVQIGKSAVTGADDHGCPTFGPPIGLLPDTNTSPVHEPVAAPDGSRVAFKYQDTESFELYIVAADGASQPTKVQLSDIAADQFSRSIMMGWL